MEYFSMTKPVLDLSIFFPELSLVTTTAAAVACFLNKRFNAYTTIKKSIVDFCLDGAKQKKHCVNTEVA